MATNTTNTFTTHTGNGTEVNYPISFEYITTSEIDITVAGVIKTLDTHYTISGATVTFTVGNVPANGAAIKFQRDTSISNKAVDFQDGSVLTEADLDSNTNQILFAQQEMLEDYVKRDGSQTITGNLVFEGATDDDNETTLAITDPTADRTITVPDITGTLITTGDTGTVSNNMLADAELKELATMSNSTASSLADLTAAEVQTLDGITASTSELNKLDGVTASTDEINKLDGVTATTTEINYVDGVTSNIQTQLNNKQPLDSELTTLAGMQSGTASKLADSTALTADIADLNQIDGLTKQTTISDTDASFPTSGAVVDYITAQIEPIGGLEVIATDAVFPNVQPAAGVVISIADAGGVVVTPSGVSTTGRTVGGATVTINGINSAFNNSTVDDGVAFMVSSTGANNIYNFHKATLREADILAISGDINDFADRYRVGASNPTSDLDQGDLFFNTSNQKFFVYNGTIWDEVQSVGNFHISGFNETIDGSRTDFTINNAPANAQQLLVSINGIIQKPNSGNSNPSEGFALDGNIVKLSSPPVSGSSVFVTVMGSTVDIGTPSANTVTSAILQNGSVQTAKLADQAVTLDKLLHGDASSNGKFLRANNGADPSFETIDLGNLSGSNLTSGTIPAARFGADTIATGSLAAGALPTDVTIADANISGNLTIESADIVNGTIVDADINGSAAIALSKLATGALPTAITVTSANITNLEVTTVDIASGAVTSGKIANGTIVNGDINASAAIANSKLADSGVSAGTVGSSTAIPILTVNAKGIITATSTTAIDSTTIANGSSNVSVANNGAITSNANHDFSAGIDVTGNITVTGTVDGVDIAGLNTTVSNLSLSGSTLANGTTATTQAASDATTKVATTAFVGQAVTNLIDSSPSALNTLNELAAALGDDANFSTTVTNSIATKLALAGGQITGNITCSGSQTFDGRDLSVDGSKLDGIEAGATADQTNAEIRAAVEAASDSNVFTDADHTKLNGIEASATADQTAAEIRALVNSATDSNVFTNALLSKLNGIAASATNVTNNNQITNGAGYITAAQAASGNATTLDNLDSTQFVRSDASDTLTGTYTFAGSYDQKIILNGTDPYIRWQEGGTNKAYIQWNSSGYFDLVNQETSDNIRIGGGSNGLQWLYDGNTGTIWHSGNDGAGSGLDADTLDGVQGSSFLRSDTADTATGKLTTRDIQLSAGYHLQRSDHHTGHLEGSYNNVGDNSYKSNPIYTIGSNYNPGDAALSNMYGIGFSHQNASFISGTGATGWGLYVAADGDARIFLSGSHGTIQSTGQHYVGSNVVWNAGNDGSGSGLDADKLDNMQPSVSASNSTIVARHSSGYIYANYFNTSPNDVSTGSITKICAESGNDGFIRHATAAAVRSFLNVADGATAGGGIPTSGGTFTGDVTFTGGASAVYIQGGSDIRFESGTWTGDSTKIQHHSNWLYMQGGSNGIRFRHSNGTDRCYIDSGGHLVPAANNSYDLGNSSMRWRNIYTGDLNLSNEGSSNDVDGTFGSYTIQEGHHDLFLINKRTGKKYKFNLTEVS